jgi:hypothetical protein
MNPHLPLIFGGAMLMVPAEFTGSRGIRCVSQKERVEWVFEILKCSIKLYCQGGLENFNGAKLGVHQIFENSILHALCYSACGLPGTGLFSWRSIPTEERFNLDDR